MSIKNNLKQNKIGLGLAALGRPGYINLNHSSEIGSDKSKVAMEKNCHEVLSYAYKRGIRYFDAARVYGLSEKFLGSWLDKNNEQDIYCGSKWGYEYLADWKVNAEKHERKDHSVSFLKKQLEESKSYLKKNLHLYQIHSATTDTGVLDDNEVLRELEQLKGTGIAIGLSTSGLDQNAIIEKAIDLSQKEGIFDSIQITLNLLEQSCLQYLEDLQKNNFLVIVKEAFANGRLTSFNNSHHQTKIELLHQLSSEKMSIEEISYCWLLENKNIDIVLSGATTQDQIDQNILCLSKSAKDISGELENLKISKEEYWQERKLLTWN
jgi:aryl-alcohol dehydrogenase-like predicted oxidoreductase